jgi:membrane-associated phospholipid phosphatase
MISRDNLGPLLVGAAVAGVAAPFDSTAQGRLLGQAPGLSRTASTLGGTAVMAPLTLGLFASGRFAHDTRFRAFSYDATQAMIVNGVYTEIFKRAASRTRPDGSDSLSFPSGHASNAFALATVADRHYGWKLGVPAYLAASAVGLSRISNDKHHLSDVLAGATLGVIAGRTVVRQNGAPVGRHRRIALGPTTDAQGTGVGIAGRLTW